MLNIALGFFIFLDILSRLVLIDVLLNWLLLFNIRFRPAFIAQILDPCYNLIQKHIPTTFGPLNLTPLILMVLLYGFKISLIIFFPGLSDMIQQIYNSY